MSYERQMYDKCKKHINCHVLIQTMERALLDGLLTELDSENATLLVPEEVEGPESGYREIRQGKCDLSTKISPLS